MTAFAEITRWFYKNPGPWSIGDVAEATGYNRSSVGAALLALHEMEPKVCVRLKQGVYMSRPPEMIPEPEKAPPVLVQPKLPSPELDFEPFDEIPDDRDLYPPFKVAVVEKRRSRRGDTYFRIRDEQGRRGSLYWDDDED